MVPLPTTSKGDALMKDIHDLSKTKLHDAMEATRAYLDVPAIIFIIVDEHGQYAVKSVAMGTTNETDLVHEFLEGPPELLGYKAIKKYLTATLATVDKCIREGSHNFNMKP
jgi:hypothetical protein